MDSRLNISNTDKKSSGGGLNGDISRLGPSDIYLGNHGSSKSQ